MARDPRCDGTKFIRQAAADASAPLPEAPVKLARKARKFWPIVMGAKRLQAWTDSDLVFAAQLCRDFAAIEELAVEMETAELIYTDDKGVKRPHPGQKLLEQLIRRATSVARLLQIHSGATNGPSHHQGAKNAMQRKIADVIFDAAGDSDLIALPGMVQ